MVKLLHAPALSALPGVRHGFTTREGGASVGPLSSLNLAMRPGEDAGTLEANWRAALAAEGLSPGGLALVSQVHGADVMEAREGAGPLRTAGEADALLTAIPGVTVAVRTADCVPLLLAAPGPVPAVAAAHAGWRGTTARIAERALEALCARSGARPEDVVVAIGPAIGPCCYEVGPEVAGPVGALCPEAVREGPRGRPHVDLRATNAALLRARGVRQVALVGGCTACGSALYSHRADGPATGRQAAFIALAPPAGA